jgi:hypothetical protein
MIQPKLSSHQKIDKQTNQKIRATFGIIEPNQISSNISYEFKNIQQIFVYDIDESKISIINLNKLCYPLSPKNKPLHEVISSELALYYLMTIFKPENFKSKNNSVWSLTLKHDLTGQIISFYDCEGQFCISSEFNDVNEMPKILINDILGVLNTIYDC